MPLLLFILVIVLIVQIGFWKTLGAAIGAFLMFALLFAFAIAILVIGGLWIAGRLTRGPGRDDWQ